MLNSYSKVVSRVRCFLHYEETFVSSVSGNYIMHYYTHSIKFVNIRVYFKAPLVSNKGGIEAYEFSVDFQEAAAKELDFLRTVDEFPSLYKGPVLKYALFRYVCLR